MRVEKYLHVNKMWRFLSPVNMWIDSQDFEYVGHFPEWLGNGGIASEQSVHLKCKVTHLLRTRSSAGVNE